MIVNYFLTYHPKDAKIRIPHARLKMMPSHVFTIISTKKLCARGRMRNNKKKRAYEVATSRGGVAQGPSFRRENDNKR